MEDVWLKIQNTYLTWLMTILPEMCRIAYACTPIQALRWITWISFVLTILSGVAYFAHCDE
jgi:hypothetical protein